MENDKDIQSIISDADNFIKILEDGKKEDKAMKDGIDFLINEWKTNKRWFRDDSGRVTTEDVIKRVFNFAWASKRNFDINKDNPNFD